VLRRFNLGSAGVPADSIAAAGATLGGAQSAAADLPDAAGKLLLQAARLAFTDALHAMAVTGAALLLIAAVLVRRMLAPR